MKRFIHICERCGICQYLFIWTNILPLLASVLVEEGGEGGIILYFICSDIRVRLLFRFSSNVFSLLASVVGEGGERGIREVAHYTGGSLPSEHLLHCVTVVTPSYITPHMLRYNMGVRYHYQTWASALSLQEHPNPLAKEIGWNRDGTFIPSHFASI